MISGMKILKTEKHLEVAWTGRRKENESAAIIIFYPLKSTFWRDYGGPEGSKTIADAISGRRNRSGQLEKHTETQGRTR